MVRTMKHFCFTYFYDCEATRDYMPIGYLEEKELIITTLLGLVEGDLGPRYCSMQEEECPDSGRLHIQGYIEMQAVYDYPAMHALLSFMPNVFWIKQRRGDRVSARDYTQKSDTRFAGPWEAGIWVHVQQGKTYILCRIFMRM